MGARWDLVIWMILRDSLAAAAIGSYAAHSVCDAGTAGTGLAPKLGKTRRQLATCSQPRRGAWH